MYLYGYAIVKVNPCTDPEEFDWEPEDQPAFHDLEPARGHLDFLKTTSRYWRDAAIVRITMERV